MREPTQDPALVADAFDDMLTFFKKVKKDWDRLARGRQIVGKHMDELGEDYVVTAFGMFSEGLGDAIDELEKAGAFDDADNEKYASKDEVTARFEAGKPADPTENMSEEDKKTWWEMHDKYKDKLKAASAPANAPSPFKAFLIQDKT